MNGRSKRNETCLGLRLGCEADIEALRSISAEARVRYRSVPELAVVADSLPVGRDRFAACRISIAFAKDGHAILGFALTRPLDGLLYLDNISGASAASGIGVGAILLSDTLDHARSQALPAVTLTTFRTPRWNGPWFRRHGFQTMPETRVGTGLRAVMDRQALSFDPTTRETLWREAQNSIGDSG
ncbi:MAG TPA: hypothetical protein VF463_09970 [Sphingobium sp.]